MVAALLPKSMNEWGEKMRKFLLSNDALQIDESEINAN